jgi:hypothetical protein
MDAAVWWHEPGIRGIKFEAGQRAWTPCSFGSCLTAALLVFLLTPQSQYKVADISLAAFGRKEIEIGELSTFMR